VLEVNETMKPEDLDSVSGHITTQQMAGPVAVCGKVATRCCSHKKLLTHPGRSVTAKWKPAVVHPPCQPVATLAKELSKRNKKSEKLVACSNVVGKVEGVVCQP
jgi:hypothetical protein